jgi:GTPase SAR1 family protein
MTHIVDIMRYFGFFHIKKKPTISLLEKNHAVSDWIIYKRPSYFLPLLLSFETASMTETEHYTITLTTTKEQLVECLSNLINDLKAIHELLNNSLDEESALNSMKVSIERLEQNRQNVINLELRICVVAPMKAGKSTIINAILGQNILPSRNAAMTVLPTEVVLCVAKTDTELPQPYLSLHQTLIDQLTILQADIRNKLNSSGTTSEQLPQRLPNHPHLVGFAKKILEDDVKFQKRNDGVESINLALEQLNDVIRLHEYLIPTEALGSTKQLCFQLPRIHAPYVSIGNETLTNQSLGNLVIVDTPGPNEDTATPFLKEIVQRELDKSFVILVVLDFSQFNTEADKAIKLEIAKIREANHKSSDTLFALVNKVDQRRKRDMTKDQVQQLIKKMFSIDEESGSKYDRIFEVQAFRALMSKQFFIELSALPTQDDIDRFDITALPSGQDFVNEAYGTAFDEDNPPTRDKAIQDARAMWRKSGFEAFLNGAIEKLIGKAAPHLLEEAFVRCRRNVHALHENLLIREQLIDADEQKLHAQIDALQNDSRELTNVMHEQMQELQNEQETMKFLFTEHFQNVEEESQRQMQSMFDQVQSDIHEEDDQQPGETGKMVHTVPELATILATLVYQKARTAISDAVLQLGFAFKRYSTTWPTLERISFASEEDARRFLAKIEVNVRGISEAALVSLRKHVDEQCRYFCSRLDDHLQNNTHFILAITQERLINELKIQFPDPPILKLKYSDDNAICTEVKLEKTYSPWWLLHLVNISYECGEKEGTSYHISMDNLKIRCQRLLTQSMKSIEENLQRYIDGELQQTFNSHFEKLQENFKRYQHYVQQSLTDQRRTTDDKAEFRRQLKQRREHMNNYEKTLETISENFYNRMNPNQNAEATN